MDWEWTVMVVCWVLTSACLGTLGGMHFMKRIQKPVDEAVGEYINALRSEILTLKELLAHHYLVEKED